VKVFARWFENLSYPFDFHVISSDLNGGRWIALDPKGWGKRLFRDNKTLLSAPVRVRRGAWPVVHIHDDPFRGPADRRPRQTRFPGF
jgi:hypothetical protein